MFGGIYRDLISDLSFGFWIGDNQKATRLLF